MILSQLFSPILFISSAIASRSEFYPGRFLIRLEVSPRTGQTFLTCCSVPLQAICNVSLIVRAQETIPECKKQHRPFSSDIHAGTYLEKGERASTFAPEGTGPFINPDAAQNGLRQGARRRRPPRVCRSVLYLSFVLLLERSHLCFVIDDAGRLILLGDDREQLIRTVGARNWRRATSNNLLLSTCSLAIGSRTRLRLQWCSNPPRSRDGRC